MTAFTFGTAYDGMADTLSVASLSVSLVRSARLAWAIRIGRAWNRVTWAYIAYWLSLSDEYREELVSAINDTETAFIALSPSDSGGCAVRILSDWRRSLEAPVSQEVAEALHDAKRNAYDPSNLSEIEALWEDCGKDAMFQCAVKEDAILAYLTEEGRTAFFLGRELDRLIRPEPRPKLFLREHLISDFYSFRSPARSVRAKLRAGVRDKVASSRRSDSWRAATLDLMRRQGPCPRPFSRNCGAEYWGLDVSQKFARRSMPAHRRNLR
ncbi:MAG: hypothetical protein K2X38_20720 [Gemmataceae bacterium]|nr:hypothetical protein [Gemmataceae bacterium]